MKRLVVMAMALVMIVCALALPASAVTANGLYGNVPLYKGTINVDGKMDDIYKQGLKIATSAEPYNEKNASEASANLYVLHDSKNLYVLIDVKNVYPISDYNPAYDGAKSWNTTCVEFYLDWTDKGSKNEDGWKYYLRLDGKITGAYKAEGKEAGITYKVAVDKTKNTYVAELCIPFDGVATGSNIGFNCVVDADKTMGKDKTATRTITALIPGVGNAVKSWKSVTLSNTEVKLAAATTAATTKAPATKPTAPATFDAGIVLAVVAAAAGAGVVVSKKRK